MSKRRQIVYHILSVFLCLASVAIGLFLCSKSIIRLVEAVRDLGLSIGYYFGELGGLPHNIMPTVTQVSSISWETVLPVDLSRFGAFMSALGTNFISIDNFRAYLDFLFGHADIVGKIFIFAVMAIALFVMTVYMFFKRTNTKHNKDTLPLKIFKRVTKVTYTPIRNFVLDFVGFLKDRKPYLYILLFIWLINTNLISTGSGALAFLFYFCVSFDINNLLTQGYKLAMDIFIIFRAIPVMVWLIVAAVIFDHRRKERGYKRLEKLEEDNREFIDTLPICTLFVGEMGKKKTTTMTDVALSATIKFRDRAYEGILKTDLHFPYFPWINLEMDLKTAIRCHKVYNLATIGKWIRKKKRLFDKNPCSKRMFDYDYTRYGDIYNNGLEVQNIWDALETYAKLYLIYITQSSLLISNYSIREDAVLDDAGNFPLWNNDFFRRDPKLMDSQSRHAHILDFDALKLGKRLVKDNERANFFEFGVICVTEGGKERGNKNTTTGEDKKDDKANRANDLFNLWLKMIRHSATVDFFPFVLVLFDEQRPMNLGADARELFDIIHIDETGDRKIVMPSFTLGEWVQEILQKRFKSVYKDYRHDRGDNSLLMHAIKTVVAKYNTHYERIANTFGAFPVKLLREKGSREGVTQKASYTLLTKKIYSRRFSSDCFADYFEEKALLSPIGLEEVPTYRAVRAAMDELGEQNSYFVNDISAVFAQFKKNLEKQHDAEKKPVKKKTKLTTKADTVGTKAA